MRHTPFDGSHPLFRIGLEPLDTAEWLEVDDQLDAYLDEKARLSALYPDHVFAAEAGTEEAQREVLDLLVAHLADRHRDTHAFDGDTARAGRHEVQLDSAAPPLVTAARLVQEDLVLMRRGEEGWRIAAASLSFPSSWSLIDKFGKVLNEVHRPVPGFAAGSRNAVVIERIFDNLLVERPARRMNWSVYPDGELFHDSRIASNLAKRNFDGDLFLRVEHQTLRRLPASGDILFTIRIHMNPFAMLAAHAERDRLCAGLIALIERLSDAELAYKGLKDGRERLIGRIRAVMG